MFLHNATLKMNNAFGHLVKKIENINGHTILIERGNLASGLYSIQLVENEKIIASRKIVLID